MERLDVDRVAIPLLNALVPSVVVRSLNVTVPVGPVEGETAPVKVTVCPLLEGFGLDVRVVVVLSLVVVLTTCTTVPDVLPLYVPSPP